MHMHTHMHTSLWVLVSCGPGCVQITLATSDLSSRQCILCTDPELHWALGMCVCNPGHVNPGHVNIYDSPIPSLLASCSNISQYVSSLLTQLSLGQTHGKQTRECVACVITALPALVFEPICFFGRDTVATYTERDNRCEREKLFTPVLRERCGYSACII